MKLDKYERICLWALIFFAFFLRIYKLNEHSIWFDEYVVIGNAKFCDLVQYLRLLYINSPDYGISPASAVVLYYWINLFPEMDWVWRLLPITFGVLTIVLTYIFAKQLVGKKVAFFACLLFCLSPFNIWFHQELKCYAFLQFLCLLSFYGLWKYFNSEGKLWKWLLITFICNIIVPWFHATYITVSLFQIPILLFCFKSSLWRKKIIGVVLSILSTIPWTIWFIKMSPFLFNVMDNSEGENRLSLFMHRLFGIDSVGLSEDLIPVWKTNIINTGNPVLDFVVKHINLFDYFLFGVLLIAIIIFIVNLIRKWRKEINQNELFILFLFCIPILSFLILSYILKKSIFHPLYFFYSLPFLYVVVSNVIIKIPFRSISKFVLLVLLLVYVCQSLSFITFKNRTDYKSAINYLEQNAGMNDIVLGQRVTTFWDIAKVYMKRDDLKYKSYYSLYGAYEIIKEQLKKDDKNRIWIIVEPITLSILYQFDPIARLTECFKSNGIDVYWKTFPGHYNLYIGQLAKNFKGSENGSCYTLINMNAMDYEKLIKELNIQYNNETEKQEKIYILKRYIAYWPIVSWINIFTIGELIKDNHYEIADKLCDYLLKKYPKFADVQLLKFTICKLQKSNYKECIKYIENAFRDKIVLEKIMNELDNKVKYKYMATHCLIPLGDALLSLLNDNE